MLYDMAGFTIHIKTKDLCKVFWKLVEDRFHTPRYNIERPLPMGKKQKKSLVQWKGNLVEK